MDGSHQIRPLVACALSVPPAHRTLCSVRRNAGRMPAERRWAGPYTCPVKISASMFPLVRGIHGNALRSRERRFESCLGHCLGHYAGGTRSNMQPDMLIAALPTDLHLYARPSASCIIPLLVPMSWPPMRLIARP